MSEAREELRFRRDLDRSWAAVRAIAAHYERFGFEAVATEPRCRPSFEDRADYGDAYDLTIKRPSWAKTQPMRFEVKWCNLAFTCADDFPYETVLVDRADKVDQHYPDIRGYFSVNASLTHAALIRIGTRHSWRRTERFDTVKGYPLTVYECPARLASFRDLRA